MGYKVQIGLSNKHLHLKEEDIEILFGKGHKLTPTKDLVQPGQFACEEKVDIVGPKATLKGIRVLGPARPETQIELAATDARAIGIKAPVREDVYKRQVQNLGFIEKDIRIRKAVDFMFDQAVIK